MAYDHDLADRIRSHLAHRAGVTEKEMFGGICFMLKGNMTAGVTGADLMVRLAAAQHPAAVAEPHARAFVMGSRTSPGMILVAPPGTTTDAALGTWIDRAVAHAGSLPPKKTKKPKKKTAAKKKKKPAARKPPAKKKRSR